MLDGINRQTGVRRGRVRATVFAGNTPAADQAADTVRCHIRSCENINHAGSCFRRVQIDAFDFCKGMRRPQEITIGLAGLIDIVQVITVTGNKSLVFFTFYRSANPIFY